MQIFSITQKNDAENRIVKTATKIFNRLCQTSFAKSGKISRLRFKMPFM